MNYRTTGANIKSTSSVAGYVVAGGESTRFGQDKALAEIGGKTMLMRMCGMVSEAVGSVSVVAPRGRYRNFDVWITEDLWPGEGPLGGIITALMATAETDGGRDWNLITSCDMPFLSADWLSFLVGRALNSSAQVVLPKSRSGLEPLCACWHTSATGKLQYAFEDGIRKVTEAMKRVSMEVVNEDDWARFDNSERLFWNMNTSVEYEEARRILESEGR